MKCSRPLMTGHATDSRYPRILKGSPRKVKCLLLEISSVARMVSTGTIHGSGQGFLLRGGHSRILWGVLANNSAEHF